MSARRDPALGLVLETRLIAVVRMTSTELLAPAVDALRRGGVRAVEITLTTPGAVEIIRALASLRPEGDLVGAGTVLDASAAEAAMDAGADFIVSPVYDPGVIRACRARDVLVSVGGLTPTEILAAWRAGADVVKVFPSTSAGPKYFKDLKGPFPEIRLMPTGGVTPENAPEFIRSGACAVAMGTSLLDAALIRGRDWDGLARRAARIMESLRAV
jgi:2-dehydro-3-deoxyphosphogluconate aldolase/(4S)-4-hydroxy-2-oxoglutarate aldolase